MGIIEDLRARGALYGGGGTYFASDWGVQTVSDFIEAKIWGGLGRSTVRFPTVPVGPGIVSMEPEGTRIPELVSETWNLDLPPAIDRRDQMIDPRVGVVLNSANDWRYIAGGMWEQSSSPGIYYSDAEKNAFGIPTGIVSSEDDDVGILGDIYDTIDQGYGGILPGGVPPFWEAGLGGPGNSLVAPPPVVGGTAPIQGPVPAPAGGTDGMIYKHTCAKGWHWAKKRKRRRKRLASASDIRDIASLMGAFNVKGAQTQAFNTFIATHS